MITWSVCFFCCHFWYIASFRLKDPQRASTTPKKTERRRTLLRGLMLLLEKVRDRIIEYFGQNDCCSAGPPVRDYFRRGWVPGGSVGKCGSRKGSWSGGLGCFWTLWFELLDHFLQDVLSSNTLSVLMFWSSNVCFIVEPLPFRGMTTSSWKGLTELTQPAFLLHPLLEMTRHDKSGSLFNLSELRMKQTLRFCENRRRTPARDFRKTPAKPKPTRYAETHSNDPAETHQLTLTDCTPRKNSPRKHRLDKTQDWPKLDACAETRWNA